MKLLNFSKPNYRSPFQIEMLSDLIKQQRIKIMSFKLKFGNPMMIKSRINDKYQELRRSKGLYSIVNLISMIEIPHIDRYKRNTTIGYYVLNDVDAAEELLEKLKSETIEKTS